TNPAIPSNSSSRPGAPRRIFSIGGLSSLTVGFRPASAECCRGWTSERKAPCLGAPRPAAGPPVTASGAPRWGAHGRISCGPDRRYNARRIGLLLLLRHDGAHRANRSPPVVIGPGLYRSSRRHASSSSGSAAGAGVGQWASEFRVRLGGRSMTTVRGTEPARLTNWAGNVAYGATRVQRPTSLDELRGIVARAPRIHALGSRHSFNDIADSAGLVTLEGLGQVIEIDRSAQTVTLNAGMRYGDLARALEREGLALHNLASLPHISVAGAVATATHGSGDKNGNLATAVAALELVTGDGDVLRVSRHDEDFAGMVVGVGALGGVTRITLDVQPGYLVRPEVFEHLP